MQFAPTLPLVVFVSEKGATAATDGAHLVAILFAGGGTFRAQNHVVAGNYKSVAIGAARILAVFALHNFFPTFGASRGRLFFVHLYFGFELLRAAFICRNISCISNHYRMGTVRCGQSSLRFERMSCLLRWRIVRRWDDNNRRICKSSVGRRWHTVPVR